MAAIILSCAKCKATFPATETNCPNCDTPRDSQTPVAVKSETEFADESLETALKEDENVAIVSSEAQTVQKEISPKGATSSSPTVIVADQNPQVAHDKNKERFATNVQIGTIVLDQYRLVREIGKGGMGAVFLGKDDVTGQQVAVKSLPANLAQEKEALDRFTSEARALAALDHECIVPLITYTTKGEDRFLVMKYVEGRSVDDLLKEKGQLPFDLIRTIMRALLSALGYAHSNGVIHRDVKPANVLLTAMDQIYLVDFGIAKREEDMRLTQTGSIVGTPLYMSPEQITGLDVDGRSDLYAAGILLYEMITGQHPYAGKTPFAILRAHVEHPPPNPIFFRDETIPSDIDFLLQSLLEKSRDRRPETAEAALRIIDDSSPDGGQQIQRDASRQVYSDGHTPPTSFVRVSGLTTTLSKRVDRRPLASVLGLILLAAVGWLMWSQRHFLETKRPPNPTPNSEIAKAVVKGPNDLLIEEAKSKLDAKDADSAIALLRVVAEKDEANPHVQSLLLDAYMKKGNLRKARKAIKALKSLQPLPDAVQKRLAQQIAKLAEVKTRRSKRKAANDEGRTRKQDEGATKKTTKQAEAPPISGGLSYEQIHSVTKNPNNEKMLAKCWNEKVLILDRYAMGTVRMELTILPSGKVVDSRIQNENIGYPSFLKCIRGATRRWAFPSFEGKTEKIDYMATFQGEIPSGR
jgi:serine/threonine protein kinase